MTFRKKIKQILCLDAYTQILGNLLREQDKKHIDEIIDEIVNEIVKAVLETLPEKEDNSANWSEEMIGETRGYNTAIDYIRRICEALSK